MYGTYKWQNYIFVPTLVEWAGFFLLVGRLIDKINLDRASPNFPFLGRQKRIFFHPKRHSMCWFFVFKGPNLKHAFFFRCFMCCWNCQESWSNSNSRSEEPEEGSEHEEQGEVEENSVEKTISSYKLEAHADFSPPQGLQGSTSHKRWKVPFGSGATRSLQNEN